MHVVATGGRRGSEIFTADLVRALGDDDLSQRVVVLRDAPPADAYAAPVQTLGANGSGTARMDGRALRTLAAAMRANRPDIVQAHGGEALKYVAGASLVSRRPPIVYRRIGSAHDLVTRPLRRAAYGVLMRRADRVVAVAEAVRRETIDRFRLSPERAVTIPNGVDPDRLRPSRRREETRGQLGISSDAPVVVSVGALTWEKDPLAHVDVAGRVLDEAPQAVALLVGDGPLRREVEAAVRRSPGGERIRLLGEREDVADLLAAADAVVLASRTEGMPAILIEAGMVGVPAAAYSLGGVPEVVEDQVTGFLAPPGDRDAVTRSVLKLLADPASARAMGRAAMERCRSRFDIRRVAGSYRRLYEEVLAP